MTLGKMGKVSDNRSDLDNTEALCNVYKIHA